MDEEYKMKQMFNTCPFNDGYGQNIKDYTNKYIKDL